MLLAREGGIEYDEGGGGENDGAGLKCADGESSGCPRMSGRHGA